MLGGFVLLLVAAADVTITFTPEAPAITQAVYGKMKNIATWQAVMCSEVYDREIAVSAPRVSSMANATGKIRIIGAKRLLPLLSQARVESRASRLTRFGEYALMGAGIVGASQGVSSRALGYMIGGMPVFRRAVEAQKERIPQFDQADLLGGEVTLKPRACEERVVFSSLLPGARVFTIELNDRRPVTIAGITSVPENMRGF